MTPIELLEKRVANLEETLHAVMYTVTQIMPPELQRELADAMIKFICEIPESTNEPD